jgi:ElaB/YqjD/DUF883 family membrane-anchored ribosome-binding protein
MTRKQSPRRESKRSLVRSLRRSLGANFWETMGMYAGIGGLATTYFIWRGSVGASEEPTQSIGDFALGIGAMALVGTLVGFVAGAPSAQRLRGDAELPDEAAPVEQKVIDVQASMNDTIEEVSRLLNRASALMAEQQRRIRGTVDDLTEEFEARISALNDLAEQAAQAERRADEARALAELSEPSRAAVDDLIDRRLSQHLRNERRGSLLWGFVFTIVGALLGIPATLLISNWPF